MTIIAEKLHAITVLGMANTRMKDYYDLYCIAQTFELELSEIQLALERTFKSRSTPLPTDMPLGLSLEFAQNPVKILQWKGFLKRNGIVATDLTLEMVIDRIRPWLRD